jgi:hypothetical protein
VFWTCVIITPFEFGNDVCDTAKKNARVYLVGGLEHEFYDFPSSWECHHPN